MTTYHLPLLLILLPLLLFLLPLPFLVLLLLPLLLFLLLPLLHVHASRFFFYSLPRSLSPIDLTGGSTGWVVNEKNN